MTSCTDDEPVEPPAPARPASISRTDDESSSTTSSQAGKPHSVYSSISPDSDVPVPSDDGDTTKPADTHIRLVRFSG